MIRPKCRPAPKRSAWRDARYRASRQSLITIVGDVGGRVDLADYFPIFLKRDRNELGFAGLAELLSQRRAFPRKREEGPLDLFLKVGFQIINDAVAGRRKRLRLIDGLDLIRLDSAAA